MLLTLNLSFESESCDCHMIVRATARLFKSCVLSFTSEKQRVFSDEKVGCQCKIVIDVECMDLHSEAAWEYITLESSWLIVLESEGCKLNSVIMPPPRGHNAVIGVRCPSVRLSVRLSDVAYIGSNSKTKRPSKTKLCTVVPQVTCDSHTDFKVKRSKVKVTGRRHIVASTNIAATWRTAADITSLKYYLILQCL